MSDKTELLAVTQEDRVAAAAQIHSIEIRRAVRAGERDGRSFVQAFARHRLATRPTPASIGGEDVEKAARALIKRLSDKEAIIAVGFRTAIQPFLDNLASALSSPTPLSGGVEEEARAWLAGELQRGTGAWIALQTGNRLNYHKVRADQALRAIQRALLSNTRDGGANG